MYRHILIPTDGSERSQRAIEAGTKLAKALGARVTGLFVSAYVAEIDQLAACRADDALSVIVRHATECGVQHDCLSITAPEPQVEIIRAAEERGCDLIVMATHGRSRVGKFLLGSVAAAVLSDCEIPVMLYR